MEDPIDGIINEYKNKGIISSDSPTSSNNDPLDSIVNEFKNKTTSNTSISKQPYGWDQFKEEASQIAKSRNYPAAVLLGQAALETGRGTSNFAKKRNNYFGYKAYDSNPDAASTYKTPSDSINAYIDLIQKSPIYKRAWSQYQIDQNPVNLIHNIKASGYATDPNYIQKVMTTPEFQQYLQ